MKFTKEIWTEIANKCNLSINYEKARTQWRFLSTMLFCETPISYAKMKLKIFEL